MNNNIVVELSNKNAQNIINNGDFETAFQPVLINEGDVIQIKNCFIDSIQQSYDQIYLPEDVNFSFTMCFYEMNNPIFPEYPGLKKYENYVIPPDYGMYVMVNDPYINTPQQLATKTINGVIKQGLYTTQSITIEINRQLSTAYNAYPIAYNSFLNLCNAPSPTTSFIRINVSSSNTGSWFDTTHVYAYQPYELNTRPMVYIGARQVALTFNDDGDNKFKFKYLHTPCYDDNGNEIVYFGKNLDNVLDYHLPVTRECGIMFTDIQPQDFWESLGFNVNNMKIKLSSNYFGYLFNAVPAITFLDYFSATTENLMTIDDAFGTPWGQPYAGQNARQDRIDTPKISNNTRAINASQFFSFKKLCPFLMIEFLTNFNGTYLTGNDASKFITAIVSRNYTSNNYITGYSDSSITYQHKGEAFLLSNIRTRIINPDTKDIAEDVGPNNYIIVQIIKNNNPQ